MPRGAGCCRQITQISDNNTNQPVRRYFYNWGIQSDLNTRSIALAVTLNVDRSDAPGVKTHITEQK